MSDSLFAGPAGAARKVRILADVKRRQTGLDRLRDPIRLAHLSHGFYRVSDADAGRIARHTGMGKKLPPHGRELAAVMPDTQAEVWLARTPTSASLPGGPKRGWVWSIRSRGSSTLSTR
jgi:hypothetical protein